MKEKGYQQLMDDVQSIANIRDYNISRHEDGAWSKFARIRVSNGLFVEGLKKQIRQLKEAGYVVSLDIEDEDDVILYVHITYDSHERVLQEASDG